MKIVPNLWFDNAAEDAAKLYTSIFKNSRITSVTKYPEAATEFSGKPAGSVLTVEFELDGNPFLALNGGPDFRFNESVSFEIPCEDQEEVDYYWSKLTENGGEESMCGWLKDRFGLSWQVVPRRLGEIMADPDQKKVEAATAAYLTMRKLDIATIEEAYASA
ncbi:VOC family protein [Salinibacterium sp. ZJ450]|uniref:VOC family protein n=1 Tax=Salinibacterium sp. ZJ450 TaxID=2708338 RepID=UPI00141D7B98|nr:VOC family protein [Salinibacterium sp. ZJ450]